MVKRLPHSIKSRGRSRWMDYLCFSALLVFVSFSGISAQNDSLCLDFVPISDPGTLVAGDSLCYELKVTNKTSDTLSNLKIEVDPMVVLAMSPMDEAWMLPFGMMSASGSSLTGSGSFMMTGSGCSVFDAADLAQGFKIINGKVTGEVFSGPREGDMYMGTAEGILCGNINLTLPSANISLSGKCDAVVDSNLLRVHLPVPARFVRFQIEEPNGDIRDEPILNADDVGTEVKIIMDIPQCPDVSPVWNTFRIEYKLAPQMVCMNDTISCAENVAMSEPIVTAGCGETRFIRVRTGSADVCKESDMFLRIDTVIYAVEDAFGNIGDTCAQIRFIEKPNLEANDITWPTADTIDCDSDELFNADGTINPDVFPYPTWDGVSLKEINFSSCNVFTEPVDIIADVQDRCARRVTIQWTVNEWKCNDAPSQFRSPLITYLLRDDTPPVITDRDGRPLPDTVIVSINDFECFADYNIAGAIATDNCNQENTQISVGPVTLNPDGSTDSILQLPPGFQEIIYTATDGCGNFSTDTVVVNVIDNSVPVAICIKYMTVTIADTSVLIRATDIDNDSYDPCGISKVQIMRKDDNICRPEDAEFGDDVLLCCSDGRRDSIPIVLRVYDLDGNFNECWVAVRVADKSAASIIGLPDLEVSCQYTFDRDSLDVFGEIEMNPTATPGTFSFPEGMLLDSSGPLVNGRIFDNCGAAVTELDPVFDIDSVCRTGTILRTFRVEDASQLTTTIQQRITVINDALNNPVFFTYVPGDVTLTPSDGMDIIDLAKDDPALADGEGCARPYVGYRDQVFKVDTGIYCTKILRTWEIIDWCKQRDVEDIIEADSVQYIFVQDDEKPVITLNSNITLPQPAAGDAIELLATATDNVVTNGRQMDWSYEVFRGSSTTPIISQDVPQSSFRSDNTAVARLEGLDVGEYRVVWTVTDICGNTETATQNLTITEPTSTNLVTVVGQVLFAEDQAMDNVEVYLKTTDTPDSETEMSVSDYDGKYLFGQMEKGGSYIIDPKKDGDILNGVSTMDMLLIQRHILGLKDLETSKDLIAADINNDGVISAFDLVELRRALLGRILEFTNNDSWTFAYKEQNLDDVVQYEDQLMTEYYIDQLESDMDIKFYGIKIGDVSGDAQGHSAGLAGGRSAERIQLTYEISKIGGRTVVAVKAGEDMSIGGLQADWNLDIDGELEIRSGVLSITAEDFSVDAISEGAVPMAVIYPNDVSVKEGDVLFTMETTSDISSIGINESRVSGEVYVNETAVAIELSQDGDTPGILMASQNTPNPWTVSTSIEVFIPADGKATLQVYDIHNRAVYRETRVVNKGTHRFTIDQENINDSGVYFYEVQAAGQRVHQKMLKVN